MKTELKIFVATYTHLVLRQLKRMSKDEAKKCGDKLLLLSKPFILGVVLF